MVSASFGRYAAITALARGAGRSGASGSRGGSSAWADSAQIVAAVTRRAPTSAQ